MVQNSLGASFILKIFRALDPAGRLKGEDERSVKNNGSGVESKQVASCLLGDGAPTFVNPALLPNHHSHQSR